MTKIIDIKAREILASGGEPSLEVSVYLEDGSVGEASVSYGASAGSKEAFVLFDEDKNRYNGRGMLKAKANVLEIIKPAVIGMDAMNLRAIDEKMIELDGTENKAKLGANAILAVSMAVARAGANSKKVELYTHLRDLWQIDGEITLPKPMIVMIEGGKHADNSTDMQEFLISAMGNKTAVENVRMEMEIYKALKSILKAEGLSTNV
jgi:enolase